jgi:rod shape determining protein RodA
MLAIAGLAIVGIAFIYSATSVQDQYRNLAWYNQFPFKQGVWIVLGAGLAAAFCLVDYRIWARYSFVFYWLMVITLVSVLLFGAKHNGAKRWIDLPFMSIQPSEFAKLAFLFAMSHFLSRPPDELRLSGVFWKGIGLVALPFVLILKEPDLGSSLVLLPVAMVLMFTAGVPLVYLRRLVVGAALLVAVILVDILYAPKGWPIKITLEDYQQRRLMVYFGLDSLPTDASPAERRRASMANYNVRQALISVGSGGIWGKGWREGDQVRLGFMPRMGVHNDFIFSVIAEEKGFLGSVTVIALYTVVLFAGMRTASQARDRLGKLLAVGVVTLLFSHIFINIGMNIRIVPVTGIPLPLLSYGGSSVLASLIAAGILQNVYLYRKVY